MQKTIHFHLPSDAEQTEHARKAIRTALEVLAKSQPDTFLGRKSYEPFPKEESDPAAGQIAADQPRR